jgi:ABC-type nitrate/sulfonate/bicarbonate transport system permease component
VGWLKGVEVAIGIGWVAVVAAEWVGTFSEGFWAGGLGYRVVMAHDANNRPGMLICIALFGVLGMLSSGAWRKLTRGWL